MTDEVDECENQIRVQAKKVRSKPKRKKENDARIEADSEIAGSFLDRCARQQTSIYTKAFTQAMKLFQEEQNNFKIQTKRKIKRQLETTDQNLSEEQLEDMVDRIGQGEDVQIFSGFDFAEEQTK